MVGYLRVLKCLLHACVMHTCMHALVCMRRSRGEGSEGQLQAGYKRSKSNCYANCTLLKIDGVRTKAVQTIVARVCYAPMATGTPGRHAVLHRQARRLCVQGTIAAAVYSPWKLGPTKGKSQSTCTTYIAPEMFLCPLALGEEGGEAQQVSSDVGQGTVQRLLTCSYWGLA